MGCFWNLSETIVHILGRILVYRGSRKAWEYGAPYFPKGMHLSSFPPFKRYCQPKLHEFVSKSGMLLLGNISRDI
jgi:hypothetical protein